ncbi:uncharacterized protein LOC117131806 [Brassica rapa]|uniref:uncharacterized protein LOC117131806 n=1 Tax=Brassica campestris TaxID=3711 RepID=UPI00142E8275|nr:uncharacterized protein LOC117131806 [Brassica rapa]
MSSQTKITNRNNKYTIYRGKNSLYKRLPLYHQSTHLIQQTEVLEFCFEQKKTCKRKMAGKVYMVMALIIMGFVLQACNGMNVDVDDGDDIKPTEDSRFFCFRVCSIRCGKQNKPCYQECLPKCGLPRRLAKPTTTSPSSPSSTV